MTTQTQDATNEIRKALKTTFPAVEFEVGFKYLPGRSEIGVSWVDGVTVQAVEMEIDLCLKTSLAVPWNFNTTLVPVLNRSYSLDTFEYVVKDVCCHWNLPMPRIISEDNQPRINPADDIQQAGGSASSLSRLIELRLTSMSC